MIRPGVYAIQNLETGRTYIGSSSDIRRRWAEHRHRLRTGEHHAHELQVDWQLYGESAFAFVILEIIHDEESRILSEQLHIDRTDHPYNVNERAGSGPKAGFAVSDETKRKLSAILKGRKKSPAHRQKLADAMRGKKHTPEHNAKIGAAGIGKKRSAETRAKMSASRRKVLVTWGDKISAAKRGKPCPAVSIAKKGKPWSDARRKALELSRLESEV